MEHVVAKQLVDHIHRHGLDNSYQSAYKPGHSTETALLSIKNDIPLSLSWGEPTALVLLDLSAAFDTIDHSTLLGCLLDWFGVGGSALKRFSSYLTERYQSVKIGSTFYPTALKGCWGIVFTHGVRMDGRASGRAAGNSLSRLYLRNRVGS